MLLGPVEYTDPPDALAPIPVAAAAACRKGAGKSPLEPSTQMGLVGAI